MQDAPDDLHQGKWFVPLALLAVNASFSCGCGRRNTFLSRHTIVMSVGREREEKLNSALAASKAYGVILRSMHTCLGKHLQAAEGCSHLCSSLPSDLLGWLWRGCQALHCRHSTCQLSQLDRANNLQSQSGSHPVFAVRLEGSKSRES